MLHALQLPHSGPAAGRSKCRSKCNRTNAHCGLCQPAVGRSRKCWVCQSQEREEEVRGGHAGDTCGRWHARYACQICGAGEFGSWRCMASAWKLLPAHPGLHAGPSLHQLCDYRHCKRNGSLWSSAEVGAAGTRATELPDAHRLSWLRQRKLVGWDLAGQNG